MTNIITPNGDGRNETLEIDTSGPWTLEVFDRWGRRVWSSPAGGYANDWHGQGGGAGSYFYLLSCPTDGRHLKGWVQVEP